MPKKKPIDKRLNKLFEDLTPESPAEPKPAAEAREKPAVKRAPVERSATTPVDTVPESRARRALQPVSAEPFFDRSKMSLAFQSGQNAWATLQVVDEAQERDWTPDEQLLVKQVTDQLSLALENARLLEEAQTRASREQTVNVIATQVRNSAGIQAILQNTVRELGKALGVSRTFIQFGVNPDADEPLEDS